MSAIISLWIKSSNYRKIFYGVVLLRVIRLKGGLKIIIGQRRLGRAKCRRQDKRQTTSFDMKKILIVQKILAIMRTDSRSNGRGLSRDGENSTRPRLCTIEMCFERSAFVVSSHLLLCGILLCRTGFQRWAGLITPKQVPCLA